ncbi:MAG: FHA domain-containing protein [Bacteroidaceae bacterium]|nr:FHA domain-containing protein [Bacteroidaceae bacterium]
MKRVRCPKCETYITFDESRYADGQQLVFKCPDCNKQFAIRMGHSALRPRQRDDNPDEQAHSDEYGSIVVIENVFHFKQVLPLRFGDNVIGRRVRGTAINLPVETIDPSVDTRHCIITVTRDKAGDLLYLLRDAPSATGTFVGNTLLRPNERRPIADGTVVSIGATTFILRAAGTPEDD